MAKFDETDLETQGEGLGEGLGNEPTNPTETPTNPTTDDRRTDEAKKPGSWKDDPEYRKFQQERDKQSALEKRLAAVERERQEERQRNSWYEQQLEVLQTQHLDEPSKLAFENNKLRRQMAAITQQQQMNEGRHRIFGIIQKEWLEDGVVIPHEVFADATDADDAWSRSRRYASALLKKSPAAKAEKREANQVDLGGGSTVDTDLDRKLARAFKDGDSQQYMKLLRQTKQQE